MNNNFFAFARYLRDLDLDVTLFLTSETPDHFQPESDTNESTSNITWIKKLPVSFSRFGLLFFRRALAVTFEKIDIIVADGISMAYLERSGVSVDVFFPYGSDLYLSPFYRELQSLTPTIKRILSCPLNLVRSYWQKRAIKNAKLLFTDLNNNLYKNAVESLGVFALNGALPMFYSTKYTFTENTLIGNFTSNSELIVVSQTRHIWASNPDNLKDFSLYGGSKRNDKLIRAFARFLKNTKFNQPLLVFFEYGPDVLESKKLITLLGIENNVQWLPKSPRTFIMNVLRHAHFGADQFREGISGLRAGTGYETMASGVPLITNTNGALHDPSHPFYNAPILDAEQEDDIFNILNDYERQPEKYKEIGQKSKEWFEKNLGIGLAKQYAVMFKTIDQAKRMGASVNEIREQVVQMAFSKSL